MCDRDIRNFFKADGSKSSTNKSNMIKQITLNPQKDIKKITKKPKKRQKSKVIINEEEKQKDKNNFLHLLQKK